MARLAAGKHDVEATMPHYLPAKVAGLALQPATSDVLRLTLKRDTYKLAVSSEPEGAQVYVDGYSVGTTPLETEIDRRIDVYALGCVAFEMWTGTPPFSGPNYVTVLAKHMDEKPPRIRDVRDAPPALDQLVTRMLAKNPEDRPADMAAVITALQRVADDEGVAASVVPARAADLPSMPSLGPMSRMSSTKRRFTRMKRRTRRNLMVGGAALRSARRRSAPSLALSRIADATPSPSPPFAC